MIQPPHCNLNSKLAIRNSSARQKSPDKSRNLRSVQKIRTASRTARVSRRNKIPEKFPRAESITRPSNSATKIAHKHLTAKTLRLKTRASGDQGLLETAATLIGAHDRAWTECLSPVAATNTCSQEQVADFVEPQRTGGTCRQSDASFWFSQEHVPMQFTRVKFACRTQ